MSLTTAISNGFIESSGRTMKPVLNEIDGIFGRLLVFHDVWKE